VEKNTTLCTIISVQSEAMPRLDCQMASPSTGLPSVKHTGQDAEFVLAAENRFPVRVPSCEEVFSPRSRWVPHLMVLCAVLAGGPLLAGRAAQGIGIRGTVKDLRGQPVSNAKVTLSSAGGIVPPATATTSAKGHYEIRSPLPGVYLVCAEAAGYLESQRKGIVITADGMAVINLALSPAKTAPAKPGSASGEFIASGCQKGFLDDTDMKVAGFSGSVDPSGYSAAAGEQTRISLMGGAAELRKQADTSVRDEKAPTTGRDIHVDHSLALKEYERAFQMAPSEENRYNWGLELLRQGDLASAVKLFKDGVADNPRSAKLWIGLGIALYSCGHGEAAVRAFLSATDVNPSDPRPYLFLGKACGISNKLSAEVNSRLNRWIQLEPRNAQAYYYAALSLWKGKGQAGRDQTMGRIESLFRKSALLDPMFLFAHLQLGNVYSEENRLSEAISEYKEALRMKPNWADAYYGLGQAYFRTGQKELGQQQMAVYEELRAIQLPKADLDAGN